MKNYPCPGHPEGEKCKFCGRKDGYIRRVPTTGLVETGVAGGETRMNPATWPLKREPIVDPCCKQCAQNMKYVKKFDPIASARFGHRIPKSYEV